MDEASTEQQPATEATGQTAQEIIGGAYANAGQFPYQVRITVDGSHYCGGSLIKPNWVLTAAHCVEGIDKSRMAVIAGDHRIISNDPTEQTLKVRHYVMHPYFTKVVTSHLYDVAVIQLYGSFTLNSAVQTIALPAGPAPKVTMTASGWGWASGGAYSMSNYLKYANLPVNTVAACDGYLSRNLYPGQELCVGYANGVAGGCHGDSGGPLAYGGRVYGVMSWGRRETCDSYTVFADVYPFVSWIRTYTGP